MSNALMIMWALGVIFVACLIWAYERRIEKLERRVRKDRRWRKDCEEMMGAALDVLDKQTEVNELMMKAVDDCHVRFSELHGKILLVQKQVKELKEEVSKMEEESKLVTLSDNSSHF